MTAPGAADASHLHEVAQVLAGALTVPEVSAALFAYATGRLGGTSTGLWLLRGGVIQFVGGAGIVESPKASIWHVPIDSDLPAAECTRLLRPVSYSSVDDRDRRWPELAGKVSLSEGTIVMPLSVPGRSLGCFHIGFPGPMGRDDFDFELLGRLARLCSASIDRALLHDAERARQQLLLDASDAVAHADGVETALQRLAAVAVPALADVCLIDVRSPDATIKRVAAVHRDPGAGPIMARLVENPPVAGGRHPASIAMAERRSVWADTIPDAVLRSTVRDEQHWDLVRRLGFSSYVSVPLISGGQVLGAVTLVSAGSGRRLDSRDVTMAEDLAQRVADVVMTARRLEHEHGIAHTLQRLLLPAGLPEVEGFEVAARYRTADVEAEAGGDFYDMVRLPSGRVGFMVGDVEGHDTVASAIMGQVRSATRALAGQLRGPAAVTDALRWSWDLLGFARMATALVGRVDPVTGEVLFTSAGHLPPLVLRADGAVELTPVSGSPPLGAPAQRGAETIVNLEPGDTFLMYTDGLVQGWAGGIDDQLEELRAAVAARRRSTLDQLCDGLLAATARSSRADDVALLALRRS